MQQVLVAPPEQDPAQQPRQILAPAQPEMIVGWGGWVVESGRDDKQNWQLCILLELVEFEHSF